MKAVGIRELKNRLSDFLRLVRQGERVLVTDRGTVVAELGPPSQGVVADEPWPALAELVREGRATWEARNDAAAYPAFSGTVPGGTVHDLLDAERLDDGRSEPR
jgi:antitoxin (DNA-binding transcriptional repressor) of toxin-antitoxin stability system